MHERALDVDAVVDPRQQHGLIPDRDARPGELVDRPADLGRDLVGVIEMEIDPDRVIALEHLAQLVIDALGHEDRNAGADPDDFDVGDLPDAADDRFEELGRERQAVTAADQDVAHLRGPSEVVELGLVLPAVEVLSRVADDPAPRAVPAIAGALGGDEHQDAVGVAVDQAGDGGVAVLREGVLHHPGECLRLATCGDDLAPDRVVRIPWVDQADEVGRDVDPELVGRAQALALVVRELQDLGDFLEVVDAVRQLPAPVVPFVVGDVQPLGSPAADCRPAVRPERSCRIAQVEEGSVPVYGRLG